MSKLRLKFKNGNQLHFNNPDTIVQTKEQSPTIITNTIEVIKYIDVPVNVEVIKYVDVPVSVEKIVYQDREVIKEVKIVEKIEVPVEKIVFKDKEVIKEIPNFINRIVVQYKTPDYIKGILVVQSLVITTLLLLVKIKGN